MRWEIAPERDELLGQVAQVGGIDVVRSVEYFYQIEKLVSDGGHLLIPHGSGYLNPADCPDQLPGAGAAGSLVGAR